MEKLKFDLTKFDNDIDRANALMNYIVNRAMEFDKKKYNRIVILFEDSPEGLLGYTMGRIINTFTQIPVYVSKEDIKTRFWEDNIALTVKSNFFIQRAIKKKDTLVLDCISNYDYQKNWKFPQVFLGFDKEDLTFIADTLYDWSKMPPLLGDKNE